jgi:hypothetical protein
MRPIFLGCMTVLIQASRRDKKNGILRPGIVPATYCSFLDYNNNAQLNRFGVHNGGGFDHGLLVSACTH